MADSSDGGRRRPELSRAERRKRIQDFQRLFMAGPSIVATNLAWEHTVGPSAASVSLLGLSLLVWAIAVSKTGVEMIRAAESSNEEQYSQSNHTR